MLTRKQKTFNKFNKMIKKNYQKDFKQNINIKIFKNKKGKIFCGRINKISGQKCSAVFFTGGRSKAFIKKA